MATILIIGPGALGTALGVSLEKLGWSPRFLGRRGPTLHSGFLQNTDGKTSPFFYPSPTDAEVKSAKLTFLAVKAYDVREAIFQHFPIICSRAPIIPVGNGFLENIFRGAIIQFPAHCLRIGVATLAISKEGKGRFRLNSTAGTVTWGPFAPLPNRSEITETERELVEESAGQFRWTLDPLPFCRKKWLYNTTLNSLAAKYRLPTNKSVLDHELELIEVFWEAYQLGEKLWGPWKADHATLFREWLDLVQSTADNENSMARDKRLGMHTESDFLAGLAIDQPGFKHLKSLHHEVTL